MKPMIMQTPITKSLDTGMVVTRKSKSTGSVFTIKKMVSNAVRIIIEIVFVLMV
jgi:hypothetical protein